MIYIYDKKTKYNDALLNNGLYSLDNLTIEATTTEDINGNYELKMTLELLGNVPRKLYDMVEVDNIIKVMDETSEELFRIAQVERGMDQIEVYARHITIADSLNLWLDNVKPTNANGMEALQWITQRTTPKCNIIFSSNLSNISTADYVRKNLYDALFDGDNAFINRWGGEVKRTGYTVKINDKIGVDKSKNIRIKEALNLTNFDIKSNIDEVHTVIYPIGYDGIIGPKVESKMINNYSMPLPIELKYEDVKLRKVNEQGEVTQEGYATEEEAKEELRRRAQEEFDKRHVDQIQLVCNVDYVDLSKYEEYKDIAQLQTTNIGDDVSVYIDTFGIDIKARVVTRVHDVLRNKRIENTLSTDGALRKPVDINKIIEDLKDKIEGEGFEDLSGYIDSMIQQGFKNGYLIYDKNAMYAVDALPKEKAKNVVVVNKNGLGYSANGIGGPYTYGFTIDGKLNADMITTGAMSGQYIKAGTIEANKLSVKAKGEIVEGSATKEQFIQLEASFAGLEVAVGDNKDNISKIKQQSDNLELSVEGKVDNDSIISSINLSKEKIKIKSDKVEVVGDFVVKSDLTDGVTKISGDNIKSGTITGRKIKGGTIEGTTITGTTIKGGKIEAPRIIDPPGEKGYITVDHVAAVDYLGGGQLSVSGLGNFDGELRANSSFTAYGTSTIKNLVVKDPSPNNPGGSMKCHGKAQFLQTVTCNADINAKTGLKLNGDPVVVCNQSNFRNVKKLAIQKNYQNGNVYLEVDTGIVNDVWGVNLWRSDETLKENMRTLDPTQDQDTTHRGTAKIGLDLIKQIEHKEFNFIGEENYVNCGYSAQNLQKLNNQLVIEVKQGDGSVLLQPTEAVLIPNISYAIQQQQKMIEVLQQKIQELETKLPK